MLRRLRLSAAASLVLAACTAAPLPQAAPVLRAELYPDWLKWPDGHGCAGTETTTTLAPGTKIDRYGADTGTYFSVPGTAYAARSLPFTETSQPYTVYLVVKPLPVQECKVKAWFGETGGGEQFKAAEPAARLVTDGIVERE